MNLILQQLQIRSAGGGWISKSYYQGSESRKGEYNIQRKILT